MEFLSPSDRVKLETRVQSLVEEILQDMDENEITENDSASQTIRQNNTSISSGSNCSSVPHSILEEARAAGLAAKLDKLKKKNDLERQMKEYEMKLEEMTIEMELEKSKAKQAVLSKYENMSNDPTTILKQAHQSIEPTTPGKDQQRLSHVSPKNEKFDPVTYHEVHTHRDGPAEVMRRMHLPKMSMETFGGDIMKYRSFVRQFENNIASKTDDEDEKLYYLEQMTSGVSVKVGELRRTAQLGDKADAAAVPCVFAPDNSRVAWSCGDRKVVILPWNAHRNCLVQDNARDASGRLLSDQKLVISTGLEVCAMAFWLGADRTGDERRGTWKRFDFTRTATLATGHPNGRIRLWSLVTGALLLELMDHRGAVRDVQFAPDGSLRLVSASADKTLKAWDLMDDGNMFKTLPECRVPLLRCAWRPDARQLVTCGRSKLLYVFDMVNYRRQLVLEGHYHEVSSCSYSYDGRIIISSSLDTRAILWDAETGAQLRTLCHVNPPPRLIFASGENGAWVKAAALSGSMCQAATVCEDGLVRFWHVWQSAEVPAVEALVPRAQEDEMLTSCAFNQAGTVLAVGTSHGSVTFFTVPKHIPTLKHLSRRALRRVISGEQLDLLPLPDRLRRYLKYAG